MSMRMLGLFGGCVVIALAVVPLAAQESPPTRVAVLRLDEVLQNYTKAKEGKKALEAAVAPYKLLLEQLKEETNRLQQAAADPKGEPVEKDAASKKLVELRRKMEDLTTEAQKVAGKKSEQLLTEVYADVEAAVQRHADAHQIDLVLTYTDAPKEDRFKYPNVMRKINAASQGGVVPLFIRPRIDITHAVLQILNEAYVSKE
jgi:Skp family chaperone for outer membrane proteins